MGMFKRTNEIKVLRDPIHGYIHIEYQVIWDCLNAKEFQRLHRIHQLGGDFQVYHTAEHSRFAHSLGVYEIVRRMETEVESISSQLTEYEKIQGMCAALLHDIGHGPFSHLFETISKKSHEKMSMEIILDPTTQVHQALIQCAPDLPDKVVSILNHEHEKEFLNQMISSQMDADRMDYLLRDAYETGTSYGNFDLERILRTLRVHQNCLCIKESGMHSVEDYIMARYHMYWQVYLHPDAKSYEVLIHKFFKRYEKIRKKEPNRILEAVYHLDIPSFFLLDEYRMMTGFQEALFSKDPILKDLASRILNRRLFEWIEEPTEKEEQEVLDTLKNLNLDPAYYFHISYSKSEAYLPYVEKKEESIIWVLDSKKNMFPLSEKSEIVRALLKMETKTKKRIYFAKGKAETWIF